MANNNYIKKNIGTSFKFTLKKTIKLPPSDEVFYVIEDENNFKFTIPRKNYLYYNYKIGDQLICKLDQINCDGKIFFEPQNPYYSEGNSYTFKFVRKKKIKNYLGFDEDIAIVIDHLGAEQWVRYAQSIDSNSTTVTACVEKIKKGRLYLLPNSNNTTHLKPGKKFQFRITGRTQTDRFGAVYLISDEWGNTHTLPIKDYNEYRLEEKESFWATIKRFSSKGFFYIEPDHPLYELNSNYNFKIIDKISDAGFTTYFFMDGLNKISSFKSKSHSLKINEYIKGKVTGLKKGRIQIELCQPE